MRCKVINITTGGRRNRPAVRLMALILCALVVAVFFLSLSFVFSHLTHTHDQDGPDGCCALCAYIQSARNFLKTLSVAMAFAAPTIAGLSGVFFLHKAAAPHIGDDTPAKLKVRLNN
jgi:hypothetical protein